MNILNFSHGWLDNAINQDASGFQITPKVLSEIYFDIASKRYKWKDGNRFVSKSNVLDLVQRKIDANKQKLIDYAPRIKAQELGLFQDVAKTLKDIHILEAIKAKGGFNNVTDRDLLTIGNELKKQYYAGVDPITGEKYGLKFLLKDSKNDSEAQIANRLRLFGQSGEITGNLINEEIKSNGSSFSMRKLGATHQHCDDCLRYAAMGWQPIGVLPVPKVACACNVNCKCSIVYK